MPATSDQLYKSQILLLECCAFPTGERIKATDNRLGQPNRASKAVAQW